MRTSDPLRCVLLVDSRAAAGAWAKGRSSSRNLNRIIRQALGWSLVGRKSLRLVWVRSEANPADFPSQKKRIPPPSGPPDDTTKVALGSELDDYRVRRSNRDIWRAVQKDTLDIGPPSSRVENCHSSACEPHTVPAVSKKKAADGPSQRPAAHQWKFREIFAGSAHLTKTFKARGIFQVEPPFEILHKGEYNKDGDILDDKTFNSLCAAACAPRQYWHFGFPCGSFSLMQNMNGSSRSKDNPLGDGTIPREVKGNEIMHRAIYLCQLLHQHGSFFALENPLTSYAWRTPAVCKLIQGCNCQQVAFDQCQFGLQIPGIDGVMGLALKPTKMVGTLPHLDMLPKKCSREHTHVAVLGGVRHRGKWQKRSQLAGAYPRGLCVRIARAFERSFRMN